MAFNISSANSSLKSIFSSIRTAMPACFLIPLE